jgi:hypothetical protein
VLNFGRQSSFAAHTFAGSAEPVSSLMRSELTRGRALAVEVIHHALDLGFHCGTKLFRSVPFSRWATSIAVFPL